MTDLSLLAHSHDLRLPDWGPYTKKYTGISHLPDLQSGLRFDLSVLPGYYRRQVLVPNAKFESGFHPWEAAPDLSYYAYRYELEWKDQVFCDVSFSRISPSARLVRSQFSNRTSHPQNLVMHYMASLNFPPVRTYSDEAIQPARAALPKGALWLGALDYDDLTFAVERPQDTLVYDGLRRGEQRDHGFTAGSGVGMGFGADAGDRVSYTFRLDQPIEAADLVIRCRTPQGKAAFELTGLAQIPLELPESPDFTLVSIPLGNVAAGEHTLELCSQGTAPADLDGFVLVGHDLKDQVHFEAVEWHSAPRISTGPIPNSLVLEYDNSPTCYGIAWTGEPWIIRELYSSELDRFLRYYVQEHVRKVLYGEGGGHFSDVFIRPIEVLPGESRVLYALVCNGSREEVESQLGGFDLHPQPLEDIYNRARAGAVRFDTTKAGERYTFSQERMAATLLSNVVYPVYTRRSYIRHYTPGKWWDCLYTWDSGFIGLGLLELDVERAIDCLNAYTTPPGDPQAAFLHHGSMVPVQHYLFHELWNRTQDRALLEYFYPRLRQYYRFFAGRQGSSTTRKMKSGLLKTWDYFYNSGGWDDYPPQVYVHANGLEETVTPVISTAHGIRTAKLMQQAARAVGEPADLSEYQADIDAWTGALNRWSWDEQAGYFSYVRHSAEGQPLEIVRHESGQNYDMGLDGASPFFAGVCSPAQEALILERLSSPERMWTRLGMCTVDKTAAYYKVDGYWNGAVWFPQQWFYWKALLDMGYAPFAAQIAATALETWKAEVDDSYHCFEHFIVQSGRGAGWHQFGGLSSPVLNWFGAYHRPGRLTVGFDTWIERQQFLPARRGLTANLIHDGEREYTVIAALEPTAEYQATFNGSPVNNAVRLPGVLEISLQGSGELAVTPTL